MSFKREGDDLSVLNILKQQRVSELLASHIPEDEARLLSNGRLTCTVCYPRQIFDTVAVLGKHRKGKKHILELSRHLRRKEELEFEALKKIHFKTVKCEMSMQSIISPRLLGCGGREHTHSESVRRRSLELPTFSQETPSLSISTERSMTPSPRSSTSQVRRYLKTLHRKRSLESLVEQKRDNYGNSDQKVEVPNTDVPASELFQPLKENVNKSVPPPNVAKEFSLNLSGWIKDKDGQWVKDPNAEFDSDEDSPPFDK